MQAFPLVVRPQDSGYGRGCGRPILAGQREGLEDAELMAPSSIQAHGIAAYDVARTGFKWAHVRARRIAQPLDRRPKMIVQAPQVRLHALEDHLRPVDLRLESVRGSRCRGDRGL